MDKQERGALFVEQEEAEEAVRTIRAQLEKSGNFLRNFALALIQSPSHVTFSNAPNELGSFPTELMHVEPFNWQDIPDMRTVAKLIQDLRREQHRSAEARRRLGMG